MSPSADGAFFHWRKSIGSVKVDPQKHNLARSHERGYRACIQLLGLVLLSVMLGCSKEPSASSASNALTDTPTPASASNPAVKAAPILDDSLGEIPREGGVTGYAGAQSCRECHQDQYASWHRSFHRTMTRLPSTNSIQARFNQTVLTNDGARYVLSRTNDEFWVHIEAAIPPLAGGSSPEPVDVRMGLVTGSHHMQVFWVPNGLGNCQIGFPFTWLIPEQKWVPRNSTFLRPPNTQHRPETWNMVCSRCHATGTEPSLDRATKTWDTHVANLGIACEACHGPGEAHVLLAKTLPKPSSNPANPSNSSVTNLAIIHPSKLDPARASEICGFCHSMKWIGAEEHWPEKGFRYRPGDSLESTTPVMRPMQLDRQPWLNNVLANNPDIFRDFFWSDGMIRVSGREYSGLIESPCYRGGKFSCLSCHSMHESEPDDQLSKKGADNRACIQCHPRFQDVTQVTSHSHHTANSSGSLCYNCHMPHTTYGVLTAIRSHQMSNPRIADHLATGRPNACNLCHLDQPLAWSDAWLSTWYGQPKHSLTEDQTRVAESVRLGLSGDAGQRVLMAWHLGWEPALQASGRNWQMPVIGGLMDDPYAAVRCVAERSMKAVGGVVPAGFEYFLGVESRPSVRDQIWDQWFRTLSKGEWSRIPKATLSGADDRQGAEASIRRLQATRAETPMRLRE
ncbi:MAG: hypothetical protein EXS36_15465 [Pedosphaera sp.]|nr:hypothetical protein [Pedosphaera sp.]